MTHSFYIDETVECPNSELEGRWRVEHVQAGKGQDGEPRLTIRSVDPDYQGANPVMVTASACLPSDSAA